MLVTIQTNRITHYIAHLRDYGIWLSPYIAHFLQDTIHAKILIHANQPLANAKPLVQVLVGWGLKPSGLRVQKIAKQQNIPKILLEDGFLRSIGLGKHGYQPLSLVVDEIGIYFDATKPSKLEQLITSGIDEPERAINAIQKICQYQLSKYNHAPVLSLDIDTTHKNILVIDQTFGDQSITYGGANADSFKQMLAQAIQDHPQATIWVKTHPDVTAGKAQGYLSDTLTTANVKLLREAMNPIALLAQMDEVYVVTSHMGFEALMLGKTVYCFGMPWYAGWGLTDDSHASMEILQGRRGQARSLSQLFTAAYLHYARYVNPATGLRCTLEDAMQWLIINKTWNDRLRGHLLIVSMSLRKQVLLREMLNFPSVKLRFKRKIPHQNTLPANTQLLLWGNQYQQQSQQLRANGVTVWRMEDGFVRSQGLGAALVRPLSLVLDDVGIYYDASQPSRIERLLNHATPLTAQQQAQAIEIHQFVLKNKLSKYNLQGNVWQPPNNISPIILVPGQVEDDASILTGSTNIKTNLALLQAVRQLKPNAYIVYKPHPDVIAGLRLGHVDNSQALQYANEVITDVSITTCLDCVHEVHTITSLTGFEALLRGLKVTCYGQPFYAGWGLTVDKSPNPRRKKSISLEQLLYITLVEYPIYTLPNRQGFVSIIDVLQYLANTPATKPTILRRVFTWFARMRAGWLMLIRQ